MEGIQFLAIAGVVGVVFAMRFAFQRMQRVRLAKLERKADEYEGKEVNRAWLGLRRGKYQRF